MNTCSSKEILILLICLLSVNQSFADFSLVCPPDITISCREDYLHDLNIYGKAYTDYNGVIQYQHDCKTTIEIDDCGKGTIKRVWGVENPENWKWLSCTQTITISNLKGFGYADITWPQNIVIRACDPTNELKNLQAPYDAPTWERPKCSKPMVSYKDTRFQVDEGCEKILREWKILDWCQYDPINYPGRGLFSFTQIIKLISTPDTLALVCKKDTLVLNNRTCDTIYVNLDEAIFQSSCPVYHRIYNTSKYAVSSGSNASGYYPNGITRFYYIAEYACGTEIKCEMTVEVKNTIAPTPYCLTGVIATLMPVDQGNDGTIDDGMIEVWASDLDKSSWHKCPGQKLRFSFSKDLTDRSRIYTCKDVGNQEVEIWVTDSLGNQDVCKTSITIQNNNPNIPNCDGNLQGGSRNVSGQIYFYKTAAPKLLEINLKNAVDSRKQMIDASNQFQYAFENLAPQENYTFDLKCIEINEHSLDYNDLILLRKIINGQTTPNSPYMSLAADINSDLKINQQDFILLQKVINTKNLNLIPVKWKFLSSDFQFTNPTNPFTEYKIHALEIGQQSSGKMVKDVLAIRTGDLSNPIEQKSDLNDRSKDPQTDYFSLEQLTTQRNESGTYVVHWNVNSSHTHQIKIQCLSLDGRILLQKQVTIPAGRSIIEGNLQTTGLIFYKLEHDQTSITGKLNLIN